MAQTVTGSEIATLQQRLDRAKKPGDKDLYTHVTKVMSHMMQHCPDDPMNKLEEVSYILKRPDTLAMDEFLKVKVSKDYARPSDEASKANTAPAIEAMKAYFKVSHPQL
jgi:hypothetical protein